MLLVTYLSKHLFFIFLRSDYFSINWDIELLLVWCPPSCEVHWWQAYIFWGTLISFLFLFMFLVEKLFVFSSSFFVGWGNYYLTFNKKCKNFCSRLYLGLLIRKDCHNSSSLRIWFYTVISSVFNLY